MGTLLTGVRHGFALHRKEGVSYLTIPSFEEAGLVRHCFTTRLGGVSGGCYAALNLSKTRENSPKNKEENYRRVCAALGFRYDSLTLVNYAHGDGVCHALPADAGKGITRETDLPECDALLVSEPGVTAVTLHADCVPLFFADPVHRVAAVSHAGWRGVYHEIARKILSEMERLFGTDARNVLVGIGPHIMPCCFEVQADVAEPFAAKFGQEVLIRRGDALAVDLQAALLGQLLEAGVMAGHITCADLCTSCNSELFYSHRRDHGNTGAMGSFLALDGWAEG